MADFTSSYPSSSDDKPVVSAAIGSLSVASDDAFEDACSICLEPFGAEDPASITSCNHEYHIHCILEWSQRSKECPICWQLFDLKDPACQELLNAVQMESSSRIKDVFSPSPTPSHFREEIMEQDSLSSADSDFDERIMQHLAAIASRARATCRREKQRSSGPGSSQARVLASPAEMFRPENTTSIVGQGLTHGSSGNRDSSSPASASQVQVRFPLSVPFSNLSSVADTDNDGEIPYKPSLRGATPSEIFSFPELKSKWSTTSARYKESISRSTKDIKEKLLAHNNSVKELSRGVKREMSAGIAGISRMIERLDLNTRPDATFFPEPRSTGVATNLKGKHVQENIRTDTLASKAELNANDSLSKATRDGCSSIQVCREVSNVQIDH